MAKYDIFISYSSKDLLPLQFCNKLENNGLSCWIAPRNIYPGIPYAKAIMQGISESETVIVFISHNSILSKDVRNEIYYAHRLRKNIIPLFIEDIIIEDIRLSKELAYYLNHKRRINLFESESLALSNIIKIYKGTTVQYAPARKYAPTCEIGDRNGTIERPLIRETYGFPESKPTEKRSIWNKLFGKKEKTEHVNASAYAPREITHHKHFIIRIFIHRLEESDVIDQIVKDVDETAVKKANKPLDIPIKIGDKITIHLTMTDGIAIDEPIQSFVWKGHYIECDFGCELIKGNVYSVFGKAIVAINNVPCGDLKFTIDVVSNETSKVYAPVETRRYSKIFISYAHADYSQVRGIAEGCKMNGSDYFFDRHTLQAGDIFKDKILNYIDNADLFVLCWSKNAAESEWVQIERKHALELIERGNHKLAIYPLSMPPEAPLPADMSDKYNFVTL